MQFGRSRSHESLTSSGLSHYKRFARSSSELPLSDENIFNTKQKTPAERFISATRLKFLSQELIFSISVFFYVWLITFILLCIETPVDTIQKSTIGIYRIIGNDLPPRHKQGQTLANIRFILENEQNFDGKFLP